MEEKKNFQLQLNLLTDNLDHQQEKYEETKIKIMDLEREVAPLQRQLKEKDRE